MDPEIIRGLNPRGTLDLYGAPHWTNVCERMSRLPRIVSTYARFKYALHYDELPRLERRLYAILLRERKIKNIHIWNKDLVMAMIRLAIMEAFYERRFNTAIRLAAMNIHSSRWKGVVKYAYHQVISPMVDMLEVELRSR